MTAWSFYSTATGLFTSRRFTGVAADLAANTRSGTAAIEGAFDPLSRRVNLATGQVEEYQPAAPAADELRTWAWDEITRRWVAVPTIAALRADKWEQVKAARDAAESGGFAWDGSTFDSDLPSQSRIQGAVQLALLAAQAEQPFTIDWTLADNTVRTLSGPDAIAVGMALAAHVQAVFDHGRDLREQIDAAADAAALAGITW